MHLAHFFADFLFLFELLHGGQPLPLLHLQLVNLAHAEQRLPVPVAGRQHHRLVQEVVDRSEQLLSLLDDVAYAGEFLE